MPDQQRSPPVGSITACFRPAQNSRLPLYRAAGGRLSYSGCATRASDAEHPVKAGTQRELYGAGVLRQVGPVPCEARVTSHGGLFTAGLCAGLM